MTINYNHMRFFSNLTLLFLTLFLFNCVGKDNNNDSLFELADSNQRTFIDNLSKFCGQSFSGQETFIAEGRESWADRQMTINFGKCTHNLVAISFSLGGDQSRTWLLMEEDGMLRFRHDHRNVDGTPEDITLYGGYASEEGSSLTQFFPADQFTCELLPNACNAEWRFELSDNLTVLSYSLFNYGELLFKAQFDLTTPLGEPIS